MMSGIEERENRLLERAQAGDERAFGEIIERHAPALAACIRKVLPAAITRKVSVSDVLQEVRITAFARLPGFRAEGDGALRRWLMRIAEHKIGTVIQRYGHAAKRGVGAEVTRGRRPETADARGKGGSPSQMAAGVEEARLVREALALLPDDYRRVLGLVFDEGLTLGEAGERMDRSREAAKKLYGRALARLTEVLKRTGRHHG